MTDTPEMVERVARAIYEASPPQMEGRPIAWAVFMFKDGHYARARAAIEAMMEPTPEMLEAAFDALVPAGDATACWRAMIKAALDGK